MLDFSVCLLYMFLFFYAIFSPFIYLWFLVLRTYMNWNDCKEEKWKDSANKKRKVMSIADIFSDTCHEFEYYYATDKVLLLCTFNSCSILWALINKSMYLYLLLGIYLSLSLSPLLTLTPHRICFRCDFRFEIFLD